MIRDRCFKRRLKVCLPSIKVAQHGIQSLALGDELLALLLDLLKQEVQLLMVGSARRVKPNHFRTFLK